MNIDHLKKLFSEETIKKAGKVYQHLKVSEAVLVFQFRLLRINAKMSMQDLDIAAGTGLGKVSVFERGGNVTLTTLRKWAKLIGGEVNLINVSGIVPNGYEQEMTKAQSDVAALRADVDQALEELRLAFQDKAWRTDIDFFDHKNDKTLRRMQRFLITKGKITAEQCVKI